MWEGNAFWGMGPELEVMSDLYAIIDSLPLTKPIFNHSLASF